MTLYAWLMLLSIAGPLALSFDKKVAYYRLWKPLFIGIGINGIIFLVWDSIFTSNGVWGFNNDYVWPVRLLHLPIEEWLFFLVVPYCSVFIYACLKAYIPKQPFTGIKQHITLFFIILTFVMALLNTEKTYTFWNAFIASILLLIHYLFLKREWMGYFWLAYFIHLIPFFIINGVLTGAITPEPIVWYNNEENLGIRLITIPIEDSIYALTCLLIPITVMEYLIAPKKQ